MSWKNTLSYVEGADSTPPTQEKTDTRIGVFLFKISSFGVLIVPIFLIMAFWLSIIPVGLGAWNTVWIFFLIYFSTLGLTIVAVYSFRFGQWLQLEISILWSRYTGEAPPDMGLPMPTRIVRYLQGEISPYKETRNGPPRRIIYVQLIGGLAVMGGMFILAFLVVQSTGIDSFQQNLPESSQAQTFAVVSLSAVGGAVLAAVVLIIYIFAASSTELVVLLVIVIPSLLFITIAVNNSINSFERWFYEVLSKYQFPY